MSKSNFEALFVVTLAVVLYGLEMSTPKRAPLVGNVPHGCSLEATWLRDDVHAQGGCTDDSNYCYELADWLREDVKGQGGCN